MLKSLLVKRCLLVISLSILCLGSGCSEPRTLIQVEPASEARADTSASASDEEASAQKDSGAAGSAAQKVNFQNDDTAKSSANTSLGTAAGTENTGGSNASGAESAPEMYSMETTAAILEPLDIDILAQQEDLYGEDGALLLKMEVSIPHILGGEETLSLEFINEFYESMRLNYVYDVKNRLFEQVKKETETAAAPLTAPYEVKMESEVKYNTGGYLSVIRDSYEYTGTNETSTYRRAELFDVNTGEVLLLWNLFSVSEEQSRETLLTAVSLQADAAVANGTGTFSEKYKDNIRTYFDPRNFYLSEDGIVIFYQFNTLSQENPGFSEFVIPYDSLKDTLMLKFPE